MSETDTEQIAELRAELDNWKVLFQEMSRRVDEANNRAQTVDSELTTWVKRLFQSSADWGEPLTAKTDLIQLELEQLRERMIALEAHSYGGPESDNELAQEFVPQT